MSLVKICQVLSPSSPQLNAIPVYREILHAYRECRELDSLLSSSYFNTPMLLDLIAAVRSDLKREKTVKLGRKVLEKYQLNTRQQHQGDADRLFPPDEDISENSSVVAHSATVAMAMTVSDTASEVAVDKGHNVELCTSDGKDNIPMDVLHNGITSHMGIGDVGAAQTLQPKDMAEQKDMAVKSPDDTDMSLDEAVVSSEDGAASPTLTKKAHELCSLVCQILTKQIEVAMAELRKREANTPDTVKDTGSVSTLIAGELHHVTSPTTNTSASVPPETLDICNNSDTQAAFVLSDGDLCSVEQKSPEKSTTQLPLADTDQSPTSGAVAMATPETPLSPQTPAEVRSKLECNLRGKFFYPAESSG